MLMCTPLISAENHSPSGNSENSVITSTTMITGTMADRIMVFIVLPSC